MNRTILALLFTLALTGAAQACGWNHFKASVQAQNNPVLPPVAEQTKPAHRYTDVSTLKKLDNPGGPVTPLNLAASKIVSWTHKIKNLVDMNVMQENCLTTAIYFEARSESVLGQLAVATVILNRVKASNSSASICGVVYKGANHLNACQFSFACDGKPDVPDDMRAWNTALNITTLALTNDEENPDQQMRILANATNYHADYVDPSWSKSLNRVTKIGRHIFYSRTSFKEAKGIRKSYS